MRARHWILGGLGVALALAVLLVLTVMLPALITAPPLGGRP